jgi:hypothetical protein
VTVGGYAVAAHGHPRYAQHLDVWVRVDPDNAGRIIEALGDFGFGGLGLAVEDFMPLTWWSSWVVSLSGSVC